MVIKACSWIYLSMRQNYYGYTSENVSIKIYYGICGDYFILQQVNVTKT
jgi:hypothetical protein